jgi:hypothetical protein
MVKLLLGHDRRGPARTTRPTRWPWHLPVHAQRGVPRRAAAAAAGAATRPAGRTSRTLVIASLRGTILEKHPEPHRRRRQRRRLRGVRAAVDVLRPRRPGSTIAVRIHTHVREDALLLYGFATLLEQELFER